MRFVKTPILFICFNRPWHTRMVLERILSVNPEQLYVFQDGAREGNVNDIVRCQQVRELIEDLCTHQSTITNLHTFYSDVNLGCGPGPATAISWFFEQVERGIIIEDDAVPNMDFFDYCEELLERYQWSEGTIKRGGENAIWAIGSMHLDNKTYGNGSYYCTMMNRTMCAWATWREAWKHFNLFMRDVSSVQMLDALKYYDCGRRMKRFWMNRFYEIQQLNYWHKSWDQQFWMSIWLHHGKGIMPNVNLSTNIGFDGSGIHCPVGSNYAANKPSHGILPLIHPINMDIQHEADIRFQRYYFDPKNYGKNWWRYLPYRLNRALKVAVGHEGAWLTRTKTK